MKKSSLFSIVSSILLSASLAFSAGKIQNEDIKSLADIESSNLTTTGTVSNGSFCLTALGSVSNLYPNIFVYDTTTPANIPPNTMIIGVPGTCGAGEVQISNAGNNNGSGDTLTFGGQPSQLPNDTKIWVSGLGVNLTLDQALENQSFFNGITTTQRNAIAIPLTNQIIYNITTSEFETYNGVSWVALTAGLPGGSQYSIQTNSGTSALYGDTNFIYNNNQAIFDLVDSYGGLHVEGRSGGEASFALQPDTVVNGTAGQWIFYTNGSQLNNPNDFAMFDSETGAPAIVLESSTGFLGVGRNDPGLPLDVLDGARVTSVTNSNSVFNIVGNSVPQTVDYLDVSPGGGTTGNILKINSSGFVGVNQLTPAFPLDVLGSTNILGTNGAPVLNVVGAATPTVDYLDVTSNGGTAGDILNVTSAGNVGVNTLTPGVPLDISGASRVTSTNNSNVVFSVVGNAGPQTVDYLDVTSSGGTAGNIFSISSAGYVGINTPTPASALDVNGSFNLDGSTSGAFTQSAAAVTTPYGIVWPAAQGAGNTIPVNDGSGNLRWSPAIGGMNATNIARSNSTGAFSFSGGPVDVLDSGGVNPVQSVVTTTGEDVVVGFMSDGANQSDNSGVIFTDSTPTVSYATIYFYRDATFIGASSMYMQNNVAVELHGVPISGFSYIDSPPPGTHTYTAQVAGGANRADQGIYYSVLYAKPIGNGLGVAFKATGSGSWTTSNPIALSTVPIDTNNAYNTSTGEYTVPSPGFYIVGWNGNATSGLKQVVIYVNGVAQDLIDNGYSSDANAAGLSGLFQLNANDVVTWVAQGNFSTNETIQWVAALGGSGAAVTQGLPNVTHTVWVAPNGSDITGLGTFDVPFLTIAQALTVVSGATATSPWTIHVGSGSFTVSGVTLQPYVNIVGDGISSTQIDFGSGGPNFSAGFTTAGAAVTISDASLFSSASGDTTIDFTASGATSAFITLENVFLNWTQLTFNGPGNNTLNIFGASSLALGTQTNVIIQNGGEFTLSDSAGAVGYLTLDGTLGDVTANVFSSTLLGEVLLEGTIGAQLYLVSSSIKDSLTISGNASSVASDVSSLPVSSLINFTGGANSSQLSYLNDAFGLAYTPTTAGNWSTVPTTVQGALDTIVSGYQGFNSKQLTPPVATPNPNAGTGATCTLTNATDVAGNVDLVTTAVSSNAGDQCDITFNQTYVVAPVCVLSPTSPEGALLNVSDGIYFTTTTTTLTINFANNDALGNTYDWSYHCVETQ